MKRRLGIVFVLLFVLFNIAVVVWFRGVRRIAHEPGGPNLLARRSEVAVRLQSHPFHQKIKAEITAVAGRNEDELIPALDLQWVVFKSGVEDQSQFSPELDFPHVLADRNLRKLDELLSKYIDGERCRRIEQWHKTALERHIALKETAIASLDHPPRIYENPADIPKPTPISGRRIAVCGTLFLAAKYCGTATVERMLQPILEYADTLPARLEAKPFADDIHKTFMVKSFLPDKAFLLNVLLYAAEHDRTVKTQQREELKRLIETAGQANLIKVVEVEVCAWDADVDWFDLAMLKAGPEMLDRSRGTEHILWHRWKDTGRANERHDLISSIRRIITGKP
jgi:hypothetical protein